MPTFITRVMVGARSGLLAGAEQPDHHGDVGGLLAGAEQLDRNAFRNDVLSAARGRSEPWLDPRRLTHEGKAALARIDEEQVRLEPRDVRADGVRLPGAIRTTPGR
jgi:hypothetical protein